jgi:hypothetical protein
MAKKKRKESATERAADSKRMKGKHFKLSKAARARLSKRLKGRHFHTKSRKAAAKMKTPSTKGKQSSSAPRRTSTHRHAAGSKFGPGYQAPQGSSFGPADRRHSSKQGTHFGPRH